MKLLVQNVDANPTPVWKLREFWNYNINPITGMKEPPRINHSSKIDATAKRVAENVGGFVSLHV